jgi:hypothetical protein
MQVRHSMAVVIQRMHISIKQVNVGVTRIVELPGSSLTRITGTSEIFRGILQYAQENTLQ